MTNEQLNKVWTGISVFLLVFSIDSWLRTQGVEPLFGSKLPDDDRPGAALFGFILVSVSILLQLHVARRYTIRKQGDFEAKFPIAFFESLDTKQNDAKTFQRVMYFVMHILPVFAIFHFFRIVSFSEYYLQSDCRNEIENASNVVWQWPANGYIWNNGYRLGSCDGVTFFPLLEPLLFTFIGIFVVLQNARYFLMLKRPNPNKGTVTR